MKLANNAMLGCMFVTYTDLCKHIMFTVQAGHHGTSVRFHFHVRPKPLCITILISVVAQEEWHQPLVWFIPSQLSDVQATCA